MFDAGPLLATSSVYPWNVGLTLDHFFSIPLKCRAHAGPLFMSKLAVWICFPHLWPNGALFFTPHNLAHIYIVNMPHFVAQIPHFVAQMCHKCGIWGTFFVIFFNLFVNFIQKLWSNIPSISIGYLAIISVTVYKCIHNHNPFVRASF